MPLTESERTILLRQIQETEDKITEEKNASAGLAQKAIKLAEDDSLFKSQWDYAHGIINNYEKEITAMNGDFVGASLTEQDLYDHAREKGRLYQPTASQDPKTISQFNGLPILNQTVNELTQFPPLLHITNTFVDGEDGGPAFTPTTLYTAYTAGDASFTALAALLPNTWYLLGKDTLVKVGTVTPVPGGPTGSCSNPIYLTEGACTGGGGIWTPGPVIPDTWIGNITDRYFLSGLDMSVLIGGSVETWGGYSNTERTTKTATSTTQRFFNQLRTHLESYLGTWKGLVDTARGSLNRNKDPNLNTVDKQVTLDLYSYLTTYLLTSPLQDGAPGITELNSNIATRQSFIPTRVATATAAKATFYGPRLNYAKLRSNVQSGTLSRLLFIQEDISPSFPSTGNPDSVKRLKSLKALLDE